MTDCANANLLALDAEENGIFNIGSGVGTSINQLFDSLSDITGYGRSAVYGPPKLGETRKIYLSAEKARALLSWRPKTDLTTGLQRLVSYFRQQE